MNFRDLKPSQQRRLATEADEAFDEYRRSTNGFVVFGSKEPISTKNIFRTAYSKGAQAILRRVDKLKDDSL